MQIRQIFETIQDACRQPSSGWDQTIKKNEIVKFSLAWPDLIFLTSAQGMCRTRLDEIELQVGFIRI